MGDSRFSADGLSATGARRAAVANGRRRLLCTLAIALIAAAAPAGPALSEGPAPTRFQRGDFTLTASVGLATLQSNEFVFNPDGSTASHLIWETNDAKVATIEGEWRLDPRFALLASVTSALAGDGYMEDYDWFQPGNDWTDRSRHFDTDLDHYLMIDIAGRFDRLRWEGGRLGLLGGVRYTDVQWTAHGGDFVYTTTTFRDTVGSFPAGERGITYRQQLPAAYLGPAGSIDIGNVTLAASVVGGLSFHARGTDDHWMRDLRFRDDLGSAPYVGVEGSVAWRIDPAVSLFLGAEYEHYFRMEGPTTETDTTTGDRVEYPGDAAGGVFDAWRFNAGATARF